jgi:hypothetical protein
LAGLRTKVEARVMERTALSRSYVVDGLQGAAERCLQRAPVLDRKGNPVLVELESGVIAAT